MNRANVQRRENSTLIKTETADEIPVVHRLAIIYLMLPVVIWLVGWFEWWLGVSAAVLMALGLWQALRPARASLKWQVFSGALRSALRPTTVVLLLIALVWVMTTAAGGVFDVHNSDWYTHRSIFLDLSRGDWPTEPSPNLRAYLGAPLLLRHYLGYFLVPGLIGNWFEPAALNWAVPLWTWCGVALAMFMFTRGHRGWRVFAAAAIFIFFGGMDIVRTLFFDGWGWINLNIDIQGWPLIELGRNHIEWAGRRWGILIQYSSHTIGLLWTPKHFLPGALFTLLLFQLRRQPRFLAVSGVVWAASLFWSVFVAIGLLPFVAVILLQNGIRPFLRWQNLVLALPLVGLLTVYLSSGTGDIEGSWIWDLDGSGWLVAVKVLLTVYVFEFLHLAVLLLLLRPTLRWDPFFVACLATLLFMPLYSYGVNNDWVMRGVMPALVLLSHFCADVIADYSREKTWSRDYRYLASFALLIVALVVGAITPLMDLTRANNDHDFNVVRNEHLGEDYSVLNIVELPHPRTHFISSEHPDWYLRLLRIDAVDETVARGELIVRSKYDVYLEDRNLIYVRKLCLEDEGGSRFFLHVVPLALASLPEGRTHDNFDFNFTRKHAFQIGQTCLAVRELPDSYEIGHIETGQLNSERTSHSWIAHYYSPPFRDRLLTEAGEPIIRSFYEVYLHREQARESSGEPDRIRLLYFKPACSQDDNGTRFFMHVIPRSAEDLPEHRKEAGYEELDFALEDFGGRYGGDCFAVRDLPEYDILEIRTGQTTGENSNSWQGSFTLGN